MLCVRIPGEESGITYQVRVCIDRGDNEHEAVCAVSEGSIGANLNDAEQSDVLSLEQDMPLCLAFHFCVDFSQKYSSDFGSKLFVLLHLI